MSTQPPSPQAYILIGSDVCEDYFLKLNNLNLIKKDIFSYKTPFLKNGILTNKNGNDYFALSVLTNKINKNDVGIIIKRAVAIRPRIFTSMRNSFSFN
mgnify:CR=1 FL=1|jgi:hypothetical protein